MTREFRVLLCGYLLATASAAVADNRIRSVAYAPDEIVRIIGKTGIQSTIQFGKDERVENVAVGDSSTWQITPNRRASLLFVKPLTDRTRTNMTVVTDKHTYMFDLVAGDKNALAVYALNFTYPDEPPPEPEVKPEVETAASSALLTQAAMTPDKLHFDWKTKGSDKLLPARVFDDGASLYLAWDRKRPLPAILTQDEYRREAPINYRVSGEYVIVSPIPQSLILRYGGKSATLWTTRWIAPPQPSGTSIAGTVPAGTPATQPARPPAPQSALQTAALQAAPCDPDPQAPAQTLPAKVKLADVSELYQENLTDDHR